MEWPPHSGRTGTFPEVDRAAFFNLDQAKVRIIPAQVPLLEELVLKLG
jgi:predicted NUDIX family NTP pyrophosphohydrolase